MHDLNRITFCLIESLLFKTLTDLVRLGGRLPVLCCDDGQAHLSLLVHVRVVDPRLERDLRRLERVLSLKKRERSQMTRSDITFTSYTLIMINKG